MKTFPSLTLASGLLFCACFAAIFAEGAPPRVTGNRPVVIEVPVPDNEAVVPEAPRSDARDRDLLAMLVPDEPQSSSDDQDELPSPTAVLNNARKQLLKNKSISARLVETITIVDRTLKAEGRYLQTALKTNDWHMRLEMAVKIGESTGSLLEVCNGEVLWTRTDIDSGRKKERKDAHDSTITRRNVSEIMSAAKKLGDPKTETGLIASFGLGGLPGLIAAIEQDMKLTSVKEDSLNGHPVYIVQGTWNEAFLKKMGPPGAQPASLLMLPGIPESMRIYVDRETGFPHRFLYLKKVPGRDVFRSVLTLDFVDVALDEPINPAEFDYKAPEGAPVIEQTKAFVELLTPRDTKPPQQ